MNTSDLILQHNTYHYPEYRTLPDSSPLNINERDGTLAPYILWEGEGMQSVDGRTKSKTKQTWFMNLARQNGDSAIELINRYFDYGRRIIGFGNFPANPDNRFYAPVLKHVMTKLNRDTDMEKRVSQEVEKRLRAEKEADQKSKK